MGYQNIFAGFTPNCAIWRRQKGRSSKQLADGRNFCFSNGQIWFGEANVGILNDSFFAKVGAVSGADSIFSNEEQGCTNFVFSQTAKTGKTRCMIYNRFASSLYPHKEILLNRRIKQFNENNWWQWGRTYPETPEPRIYANCKTRNKAPFFMHKAKAFDGSVLALFPKKELDLKKKMEQLNNIDWKKLGFVCDGRFLFTQRSLENAPIEL